MDQIKNTIKKLQTEVKENKKRTGKYQAPTIPDHARFKMLIKFKPSKQYPSGGYKIFYSLEYIVLKETGFIDEWSSLKKLMVFYNKIKQQDRLEFAKIYISLEDLPKIEDKKHDSLLAIITEFQEIFNDSLNYYHDRLHTKIKLSSFVKEWLK